METYQNELNTCLLHRNRQLTKQLKDYHRVEALTGCSSPLLVAMGQLLCLHQTPAYGVLEGEEEWNNLFRLIDLMYGGCLAEAFTPLGLTAQELKLCYLVRTRLGNKAIAALFNIDPRSVLKAKQRIKGKLRLSANDCLDKYIQQYEAIPAIRAHQGLAPIR